MYLKTVLPMQLANLVRDFYLYFGQYPQVGNAYESIQHFFGNKVRKEEIAKMMCFDSSADSQRT